MQVLIKDMHSKQKILIKLVSREYKKALFDALSFPIDHVYTYFLFIYNTFFCCHFICNILFTLIIYCDKLFQKRVLRFSGIEFEIL